MQVSIVLPLYNKAQYVSRALCSISAQTFQSFEIIVVDDGSTDGSCDVAAQHPDRRIKLIRQANAGPGAARNTGVNHARSEFIAFLDADDEWMPEFLESSLRTIRSSEEIAATSSGYIEYPTGVSMERLWRKRGLKEGMQHVTALTRPSQLVQMLAFMSPCSTLLRTKVLRKWGGFYSKSGCKYGEDAMLFLKVLLNERVIFSFQPLAIVHREASGLSGNYAAARPVEPFLTDPHEVESVCPAELRSLLHHFYAFRACKTAAVLGYFGEWTSAGSVFAKFVSLRHWKAPHFTPALLGCTPVAGLIGRALMALGGSRTMTARSTSK